MDAHVHSRFSIFPSYTHKCAHTHTLTSPLWAVSSNPFPSIGAGQELMNVCLSSVSVSAGQERRSRWEDEKLVRTHGQPD